MSTVIKTNKIIKKKKDQLFTNYYTGQIPNQRNMSMEVVEFKRSYLLK